MPAIGTNFTGVRWPTAQGEGRCVIALETTAAVSSRDKSIAFLRRQIAEANSLLDEYAAAGEHDLHVAAHAHAIALRLRLATLRAAREAAQGYRVDWPEPTAPRGSA